MLLQRMKHSNITKKRTKPRFVLFFLPPYHFYVIMSVANSIGAYLKKLIKAPIYYTQGGEEEYEKADLHRDLRLVDYIGNCFCSFLFRCIWRKLK